MLDKWHQSCLRGPNYRTKRAKVIYDLWLECLCQARVRILRLFDHYRTVVASLRHYIQTLLTSSAWHLVMDNLFGSSRLSGRFNRRPPNQWLTLYPPTATKKNIKTLKAFGSENHS
jgi:hypothetical protein